MSNAFTRGCIVLLALTVMFAAPIGAQTVQTLPLATYTATAAVTYADNSSPPPPRRQEVARDFLTALGSGFGAVFGAVLSPLCGIDPVTGSILGGAAGAASAGLLHDSMFDNPQQRCPPGSPMNTRPKVQPAAP